MWSELFDDEEVRNRKRAERLERYADHHHSRLILLLLTALIAAVYWANRFMIDEVARGQGEVIASSRTQVIQAVDGGVLRELPVREGDRVEAGQVVARLDETRIGAAVKEIEARLAALQAKAARLKAEVTGQRRLSFPAGLTEHYSELTELETALFVQRRDGLKTELANMSEAVALAKEELKLIRQLEQRGDSNRSEVIRAERALNEAEAKPINRRNRFFEEVSSELAKIEDEMAQNEQILTQRRQQLEDSTLITPLSGIVKNIAITTVGGVLRSGDALMEIVPVDDKLLIEAKVSPADIARIAPGLSATLRLDPFDYTIYGGVVAEVVYVSADTLKEKGANGEEIYYRVHLQTASSQVTTTIGRVLMLTPGMTAQVDIRTGERSLIDVLLKPIRKTLSQSFGER
ncbi:HlyD family efflux transporter periplasmic adaptor subunit [Ectothiorhodospiraceae bacterium BW-2]|nr:HlyD family efflux transporter periplasmic adaptor subunit [Ectothiorhodospiraceae bacterium BW-2]